MQKVYLQKIKQYSTDCYIGKADPRILVRIATKVGMSEVQDAQRPLNEKRVREIASYVNDAGILPNTLTLATKDNRFTISQTESGEGFYIELPNDESEFADYEDSIDVMDGQHRLYSFLPSIASIHDDNEYEIGFTLYIKPTLIDRQKIFISCNEKQEKVSGNLLMWFKEKLKMLSEGESEFWSLVSVLNNEYPLKDRIIMSAEKKTHGIKAQQLCFILKASKINDLTINGSPLDEGQKVKVICTYLSAWETVVGFKYGEPSKGPGAAAKIAGLRYVLMLIPTIWDKAIAEHRKFDEDFIKETLNAFISSLGVVREEFYTCEEHKLYFRDRTATSKFVEDSIKKIKGLNAGAFNPLG